MPSSTCKGLHFLWEAGNTSHSGRHHARGLYPALMAAREHGTPQAGHLRCSAASYPGARRFLLLAPHVLQWPCRFKMAYLKATWGRGSSLYCISQCFSGHSWSSVSFGLGPGKDTTSFCAAPHSSCAATFLQHYLQRFVTAVVMF